jgi:hypothetical protein
MLPIVTLILVLLLPLTIGAFYLNQSLQERKQTIADHKTEVIEIRKKFYLAIELEFLRMPLIVQTKKEVAYHNKLLVHYKNSSRKVELLSPNLGEDKLSYKNRVRAYLDKFCIDEAELISHAQDAHSNYFEAIRARGFLAYFSSPFNTEVSKEYIYAKIDFLLKNPKAEYGNYRKVNESVIEF